MDGLQAGSCGRAFAALAVLVALGSVPAFGADGSPPAALDLHTFTNPQGKTIQAAITDATLDFVFLKRDDGQSFKVALGTLSNDDQAYISQWVIHRAKVQGSDVLKFEATTESGTSAASAPNANEQRTVTALSGRVVRPTIRSWSESYNVKVTNLVPAHLTKLQLRFIIFSMAAVPGGLPPDDFTANVLVGHPIAIDDLPFSADQTVKAGQVTLSEYTMPPNSYYTNGAPLKSTDQLKGIWVRIYDQNNNLIQEWASSSNLIKENDWDDLVKKASAAARGHGGFTANGFTDGTGGGQRGD
jgi:hypothetical protein